MPVGELYLRPVALAEAVLQTFCHADRFLVGALVDDSAAGGIP